MSSKPLLNQYLEDFKNDPELIAEGLKLDITEDICRIMKAKNMNRSQLAERMQTSSAYITKVLRGNVNLTLLSIAKFAIALDTPVEDLFRLVVKQNKKVAV